MTPHNLGIIAIGHSFPQGVHHTPFVIVMSRRIVRDNNIHY